MSMCRWRELVHVLTFIKKETLCNNVRCEYRGQTISADYKKEYKSENVQSAEITSE